MTIMDNSYTIVAEKHVMTKLLTDFKFFFKRNGQTSKRAVILV